MAIPTGAAVDAIKERLTPALDTLDESVREARRFIARSQHAAEDAADVAVRKIRRRPLNAVAIAVGTGAFAGALIGFGFGWLTRGRK